MRTAVLVTAVVLPVLAHATAARADVAGVYDVKFEEVSTNCTAPLRYSHGKLTIKRKGNSVTVDIDRTPLMTGVRSKAGKVNAKSRSGNTMIQGMKGVFTVAGKVTPEGLLGLVMIAEYTANGKPLCTQAWKISGPRAVERDSSRAPRKPERKRRSTSPDLGERRPIMGDLVHLARFGG